MVEKRQYVRMSTVFPVEVDLTAGEEQNGGADAANEPLQAFTRNVSAAGMCVELKIFGKLRAEVPFLPNRLVRLTINPTFTEEAIRADARIVWVRREDAPEWSHYTFGVAYTRIDGRAKDRLIGYARRLVWLPRAAAAGAILLLLLLAGISVHNQSLVDENRNLVVQLVEAAQTKSDVAASLLDLQRRKDRLEKQLLSAQTRTKRLETSIAELTTENIQQKKAYESDLEQVRRQEQALAVRIEEVEQGEKELVSSYEALIKNAETTDTAALDQMIDWVRSHQNQRTGLVTSYEGDEGLEDWAFSYDQSLACQVFLLSGETDRASAVLRFFSEKAKTAKGGFHNAYDASDGRPLETTVQTGPNLWLAIAAARHAELTGDRSFVPLAARIGDWALKLQDAEGGLRGGPGIKWYSTEHNLDAYACFELLHRLTGEERYATARQASLEWLKKYAYSNKERRMNRGKGDATIATDTFSWAIAALGPAVLAQNGFDPDGIVEFAEQNCEVKVQYKLPTGKTVTVRGFDFAKAEHVGRGAIISTEWTAQMIVTYRILSDHYRTAGDEAKAKTYADKAEFYLNELKKLMITSPSRTGQGRGCLPYASMDNADTGHGWRTPTGRRTGSVAGTAYGIFAWKGYNPFGTVRPEPRTTVEEV
ncbi:MAG: hypothetical protein MOGMAGMI_01497 [Candidatus Omnitrophica bacterium]|nr:hypothetical protein [Candidatus Omnitrophota bacterium]